MKASTFHKIRELENVSYTLYVYNNEGHQSDPPPSPFAYLVTLGISEDGSGLTMDKIKEKPITSHTYLLGHLLLLPVRLQTFISLSFEPVTR